MKFKMALAGSVALLSNAALATDVCLLANDGFLIKGENQSVVIDALIKEPAYGYPALSPKTYDQLIGGKGAFAGLNLSLTTHNHTDHFQAGVLLEHAQHNKTVYLLPPQALADVEALEPNHGLDSRLIADVPIHNGSAVQRTINGVDVTTYSINHGWDVPEGAKQTKLNHSVYKVEIDGVSITHLGDAITTGDLLSQAGADRVKTDYLMAPYWSLSNDDYVTAMKQAWDYKTLIIMHLDMVDPDDPSGQEKLTSKVASLTTKFPTVWIPTGDMECRG